ncbi:MAG: preprotein translocase subunit SecG [Clostridia bacterium]|nr:preprotein translocase subunit SecG [Clostridia bacterium]MBQ7086379.1 preprotein translocase subunit SecG [Clostridia bacterium]MBQ7093835.1 preprotein translocase subunit SecG [Clostridia bacterium]
METVKLIMTIVQVLVSLALIISVIFQSGKHAGMSGSIDGVADTFFGKNKARSLDAKLEKLTGILAIAFIVLTFAITLL